MNKNLLREQGIPLILTFVTFVILVFILFFFINFINLFNFSKILIQLKLVDILIGLTIYLKTSIDFAIFMGNLMRTNPGVNKRIAIEFGTGVGHMAGTLLIILIWNFFREVPILLAAMIIISSLVLFRMAEESFGELFSKLGEHHWLSRRVSFVQDELKLLNNLFRPILGRILPEPSLTNAPQMKFFALLIFSLSVPFILGLDDFAGYIPLFSIVNVFGFAVGTFLGHMILNAFLFVSPQTTTKIVRLPAVLAIGGGAFLLIAVYGLYEALHLILRLIF